MPCTLSYTGQGGDRQAHNLSQQSEGGEPDSEACDQYTRQDSNLQPSVPKTDALSNCATGASADILKDGTAGRQGEARSMIDRWFKMRKHRVWVPLPLPVFPPTKSSTGTARGTPQCKTVQNIELPWAEVRPKSGVPA